MKSKKKEIKEIVRHFIVNTYINKNTRRHYNKESIYTVFSYLIEAIYISDNYIDETGYCLDIAIVFKDGKLSNNHLEVLGIPTTIKDKSIKTYVNLYVKPHLLDLKEKIIEEHNGSFPINISLFTKNGRKVKFNQLSKRRLDELKESFERVRRLSNKKHYSYTDEDWKKIKSEIFNELSMLIEAFEGQRESKEFNNVLMLAETFDIQKKIMKKKDSYVQS